MSLHFVIGRAGTGKTRYCLENIAERLKSPGNDPLILLVPEQATFMMEKGLLEYSGLGGTMCAQVLSFQRLAWRVLQETGGGLYPPLDKVGKALIFRRVLEKHKTELKIFARVADKPGFLESLIELLAEFKTYHITPELLADTIKRIAGGERKDLSSKLLDLYVIYREFENTIQRRYLDTQDHLDLLAENLHKANFLNNAEIWLDGFHGFTPQEYTVLRELLLKVPRVHVSLCLDPAACAKPLTETDLFHPTWDTYQRILLLAQQIRCPVEETATLTYEGEHRFSHRPELAFLEQSLAGHKAVLQGGSTAFRLVAAANRRQELEGTAREIIKLCREDGFAYRDIAVLVRDDAPYENLLPTVFQDHQIPYFIDRKRKLHYHPLLDLLSGTLEVVEYGWTYDPVFRYLKTDLVPLSRQEIDLLENYCLAHGIRGSRWTDARPWVYRRKLTLGAEEVPTGEEEAALHRINAARGKVIKTLVPLEQSLKEAVKARQMALALYQLLDGLSAAQKMEDWCAKAERDGRVEEVLLHNQVWRKVLELLEQMAEVLGEQEMTLKEFSILFNSGLDSIELALIPPGLDQVLVGSLDRSRNHDMKAVFILGANEGVLPFADNESGLLSGEDRDLLSELQLELAPGGEKRLLAEQFLVYTALTGASHSLWVSYPMADQEGKALSRSVLIGRLEKLFTAEGQDGAAGEQNGAAAEPESRLEFLTGEPQAGQELERIVHPRPALGYLAASLRQAVEGKKIHPLWWSVYNWYYRQGEWKEPLQKVVKGLLPQKAGDKLIVPQSRNLYGKTLRASISRLERYKACPFSHFLSYGLKLKERPENVVKAPDLGQFFHAALEKFYHYVTERGMDSASLDTRQTMELVGKITDRLIPQLQNELLLSNARYRFLNRKLKQIVLRAVKVLQEHERRGTFRPLGVEFSFGSQGKMPGLRFTLADKTEIVLEGRIDRVDGARGADGTYLRVIDYKSGAPSISLLEVFYGLKLQLLAYLDVIMTQAPFLIQGKAIPGGVLYFKIHDPFVSAKGPLAPGDVERKLIRELKMKGYLLKDAQLIRLMDQGINGYSDLIPAALTGDDQLYKNQENLLSQEEFKRLRQHVEKILLEIGEEIMRGNVSIQPYRYKRKSPCTICPYRAVCRFDPGIPGHTYRNLSVRKNSEIWAEIGVTGGDQHE